MGLGKSILAGLLAGVSGAGEAYGNFGIQKAMMGMQRDERKAEALDPELLAKQEEQLKRQMAIRYGIDPDSGQPIPGINDAIKAYYSAMRKPKTGPTRPDDGFADLLK